MNVQFRKLNEELILNGNIRVKILELSRGHVRLGIACPPDVSIRRAETALKLAEVIDANSAAREMADAA